MDWGGAAISNATWTGPKLCDVLEHLGWSEEKYPNVRHVCVDGRSTFEPKDSYYIYTVRELGSSIKARNDPIRARSYLVTWCAAQRLGQPLILQYVLLDLLNMALFNSYSSKSFTLLNLLSTTYSR